MTTKIKFPVNRALCLINLDTFEIIWDTLGKDGGDPDYWYGDESAYNNMPCHDGVADSTLGETAVYCYVTLD